MKKTHFHKVQDYIEKMKSFRLVKIKVNFLSTFSKYNIENYLRFDQSADPKDFNERRIVIMSIIFTLIFLDSFIQEPILFLIPHDEVFIDRISNIITKYKDKQKREKELEELRKKRFLKRE